jgi:hypothetical protein
LISCRSEATLIPSYVIEFISDFRRGILLLKLTPKPLFQNSNSVLTSARASVTYHGRPLFINMLLIWAADRAYPKCPYVQFSSVLVICLYFIVLLGVKHQPFNQSIILFYLYKCTCIKEIVLRVLSTNSEVKLNPFGIVGNGLVFFLPGHWTPAGV